MSVYKKSNPEKFINIPTTMNSVIGASGQVGVNYGGFTTLYDTTSNVQAIGQVYLDGFIYSIGCDYISKIDASNMSVVKTMRVYCDGYGTIATDGSYIYLATVSGAVKVYKFDLDLVCIDRTSVSGVTNVNGSSVVVGGKFCFGCQASSGYRPTLVAIDTSTLTGSAVYFGTTAGLCTSVATDGTDLYAYLYGGSISYVVKLTTALSLLYIKDKSAGTYGSVNIEGDYLYLNLANYGIYKFNKSDLSYVSGISSITSSSPGGMDSNGNYSVTSSGLSIYISNDNFATYDKYAFTGTVISSSIRGVSIDTNNNITISIGYTSSSSGWLGALKFNVDTIDGKTFDGNFLTFTKTSGSTSSISASWPTSGTSGVAFTPTFSFANTPTVQTIPTIISLLTE